ncbi:DNA polymerase epsilon catalytic subunit [Mucor circinelloides]
MATKPEFGVSSSKFINKRGRGGGGHSLGSTRATTSFKQFGLPKGGGSNEQSNVDQRFEDVAILDTLETRFGFERYQEGPQRLGWLLNMHETLIKDEDWPTGRSGVDYYFINDSGETFKTTLLFSPYFFIGCKPGTEGEVEDYLHRRFEDVIEKMKRVKKEDLKQPNHLIGNTRTYIQLSFRNQSDLYSVRKVLLPIAKKNQEKVNTLDTYAEVINAANNIGYENQPHSAAMSTRKITDETLENVMDIREYDVPYYVRVAIDLDIRVGLWYTAKALMDGTVELNRVLDLVHRPEPVILAFDIETTKLPLKFPDVAIDSIMMISYMIDGRGYLITNREIVSQDIEDFDYTPKPEFEGPFTIFNEEDEEALLRRFFEHIQDAKPTIFVTYNGDFFDWPFVEGRAKANGIDMYQEIGVYKDEEDEYKCKHATHMDAFRWVKRDSYLPQGSQGLKAVTTAKLGYNPMELDPEDMTRFAAEQPQVLAQYSVSDAVATYYLYMKYVHPFIFSLCNILPLVPDEVLRKGTGTLCELLLMVEAYRVNVIMPNKHVDEATQFYEGHLLESETYVGGHVEALEAGVFRSDINSDFKIDPSAAQELIDQLDDALRFTIQVEEKKNLEDVVNYEQVKAEIQQQLEELRDRPMRQEPPLIYHLDVAAMYPNIILTNRLQPDAMIDESQCATCEFNVNNKSCDRRMKWMWRGEYFPAKRNEYRMIENQLMIETFPPKYPNGPSRNWNALTESEKSTLMRSRLTDYCRRVYKKVKETKEVERESIICQRENPFYIETVRAFRDRRYEYKGLHKTWKGKLGDAVKDGSATKVAEAKNMIVLYDSLQLAHKVILNSFYGYVMRKGARWHSLEMAGIVCLTGSKIIQMARQLVERIGRPLELDTDGIWCILPKSFPETFTFSLANGKKLRIDYPCTMLNHLVHAQFTNDQYQRLSNPETFEYTVSKENSIFFEIDGPYRAMILPSSTAEDKLLKKRYAVYNKDGSLAELKGFEVKRRGELKLIKIFQSEIFEVFLKGDTLEECYSAVAQVADRWLDVLFSKAINLSDDELFELISENRSMSRTLEEYGAQKSTAITTAKRLSEFLGAQMIKDKGLACKFIISARPFDIPVSERAVPVAIFQAEHSVKKHFLRKWLRDNSLETFDIRDILDWDYYVERFGSVIQKIITIPAAMQKVHNPVPRVRHPDWLFKRVAAKDDKFKQHRITDMFSKSDRPLMEDLMDIDDIEELNVAGTATNGLPKIAKVIKRKHGTAAVFDPSAPLPEQDLKENMPDWNVDYPAWLEFQKRKWKRQRLIREHNKKMGHDSQFLSTQASSGAASFFRKQTGSLVTSVWEVLQIVETDIPGEYRMWIMVQDQMFNIRLTVPRTFYINSKEANPQAIQLENPSCHMAKCTRTLPRSHQVYNLYQMFMSETTYQNEIKKFTNIFNHPTTEGVYETQVPLLARAILQLGATCQYSKQKGGPTRKMDDQFTLQDLMQRSEMTNHYISDPKQFNYIFLFHAHSDSRHFFTLVGATIPVAQVFIVGLSKKNQQMPNISRLYSERYSRGKPTSDTVEIPDSAEFETSYFPNEREALKAINKSLSKYLDNKRGKSILAINSPRSSTYLTSNARMLNSIPFVRIPSLQEDNRFDALNWVTSIVNRMIKHYMELGTWIDEKISQARYSNIPFCNIPDDPYLFISDVLFARKLIQNDMVIWWSASPMPDLGGREEDESLAMTSEIVNTELSFPGAYETVCVEIDVVRLCLNTIIEANVINELEGATGGLGGFDTSNYTLDDFAHGNVSNAAAFGENMISGKTFGMLRSVVQLWFHQAITDKTNRYGEHMIDTLHRWLLSTNSFMYDPSLYSLIHSMMKKVFMQLVAEFKRLGATVVFANFHKIVLTTNKETMESAMPYFQYLYRSIQRKQVFEVLELNPTHYWDVLMWMDEKNYAGVMIKAEDHAAQPTHREQATITKKWNIEDYLPEVARALFSKQTSSYVFKMYSFKRQFPRDIGSQIREQDESMPDPRVQNLQLFIKQDAARKLLRKVPLLVRRQEEQLANPHADMVFPQLAGSHLTMDNPALEYVKSVCAVLNLDNRIEDQVRILKRSALELVGNISDFSEIAQFRNPCEYFKLTEIICSYCNYTTDLDFCRDKELMPKQGHIQAWRCKGCHCEYDKRLIEDRMITQIQTWFAASDIQDLRCSRCHTIKTENLMRQCDKCGSEYIKTLSKAELERKLKVFRNVAKEQQLTRLSESIDVYMNHL